MDFRVSAQQEQFLTAEFWLRDESRVDRSGKGKGKAIPLQAWTGPEGSRRLRLPNFKTIST
jgi:hypothetical protein